MSQLLFIFDVVTIQRFNYCQGIDMDYQIGSERRRPKGSADLIYAQASYFYLVEKLRQRAE